MCGTCPVQNPTGPIFAIPAPITTKNVNRARVPVVASAPVGDPAQGTMPNKLQPKTKKKIVHRNGKNLSASCSPIDGRATWSRMNSNIDSKKFQNRPLGRSPPRALFAKRIKMNKMINAAILPTP